MRKVSVPVSNDFCPQTLFVHGTFCEDGSPDFGLFCWFSYCWYDEMGVMAAIGGNKRTLDNIRRTKAFSANLVTENCLPLADFCGTVEGGDARKAVAPIAWEKGAALDVPLLCDSPVSFELEAERFISLNEDGSTVILCRVRNVAVDPSLTDDAATLEEKMARIAPVRTTCATYFGWRGQTLGQWHEPCKDFPPDATSRDASRA